MSKRVIAVCSSDSLYEAAQKMLDYRIRTLLITDKSKKELKGIITRGDIVKFIEVN